MSKKITPIPLNIDISSSLADNNNEINAEKFQKLYVKKIEPIPLILEITEQKEQEIENLEITLPVVKDEIYHNDEQNTNESILLTEEDKIEFSGEESLEKKSKNKRVNKRR